MYLFMICYLTCLSDYLPNSIPTNKRFLSWHFDRWVVVTNMIIKPRLPEGRVLRAQQKQNHDSGARDSKRGLSGTHLSAQSVILSTQSQTFHKERAMGCLCSSITMSDKRNSKGGAPRTNVRECWGSPKTETDNDLSFIRTTKSVPFVTLGTKELG